MERLKAADVVMFTGGDQLRLTSILGGTPFHDILLDKYHNEDFVYGFMVHYMIVDMNCTCRKYKKKTEFSHFQTFRILKCSVNFALPVISF